MQLHTIPVTLCRPGRKPIAAPGQRHRDIIVVEFLHGLRIDTRDLRLTIFGAPLAVADSKSIRGADLSWPVPLFVVRKIRQRGSSVAVSRFLGSGPGAGQSGT